MQQPIADRPARLFLEQIADPAVFCGGGSVAAVTAAGAGALALLVLRLNERRKALADRRQEIGAAIARVEALVDTFYRAADDDIASLDRLLAAQRALKDGGSRAEYVDALSDAAVSPVTLAEEIVVLLELVAGQLALASRFTVSDLGAAAVLADGAARAALLTAEVNLALLRDDPASDPSTLQELEQRRATAYLRVRQLSDDVESATRNAIHRERHQTAEGKHAGNTA